MSDMPQYSFTNLRDNSSDLVRSQSELHVSNINNTNEESSSEPGNPGKKCSCSESSSNRNADSHVLVRSQTELNVSQVNIHTAGSSSEPQGNDSSRISSSKPADKNNSKPLDRTICEVHVTL